MHTIPAPLRHTAVKGTPAAGSYFPQPVRADGRLDDLLGSGACLISRTSVPTETANGDLRIIELSDPAIAPFADYLNDWLDNHSCEAVIIRPDRYVFGLGEPGDLVDSFNQVIHGAPALSEA